MSSANDSLDGAGIDFPAYVIECQRITKKTYFLVKFSPIFYKKDVDMFFQSMIL